MDLIVGKAVSQVANCEDVLESMWQGFLEGSLDYFDQLEAVISGVHKEEVFIAETPNEFIIRCIH
jgi:hypothetical protein